MSAYDTLDCVQFIDQFSFSYQRNRSIVMFALVPILFTILFLSTILYMFLFNSSVFADFFFKDILVLISITCIYIPFLWKHYKNKLETAKVIFSEQIVGLRSIFLLQFFLRLLVPFVLTASSLFIYATSCLVNY